MPFRSSFECLWCGTPHATRSPDDIEGWAALCPTCVGRAGDNGFLRFRLRTALEERARSHARDAATVPPAGGARAEPPARRPDAGGTTAPAAGWLGVSPMLTDDWYLRRGRWTRGAIDDATWAADLDAATLWLDGLTLGGTIVELDPGNGWWTPLLASKGDVWVIADDEPSLEAARSRLLAHGLRAHLHARSPDAPPDPSADVLVTAFRLGRHPVDRWPRLLEQAKGWIRPGGRHILIERRRDATSADAPPGDGPFDGPQGLTATELSERLSAAGFRDVEIASSHHLLQAIATA